MTTPSELLPQVSVVIPTRGIRQETLSSTLRILADEPCLKQVVVVSESPDQTPRGPALRDGTLCVIGAPGRGPNSSRQAGLESATAEVVLFLDDDVLPTGGLVLGHAEHHANREGLVVVGYMPVERADDGGYASATAELYGLEYERRVLGYERRPDSVLTNLWGGNVSVRRADALRVGLENPSHPGRRHEDQDFGLRCARAGLQGVFDRSLRANHRYDRSRRDFLRDAWAQGYERTELRRTHPDASWHRRSENTEADPGPGNGTRTRHRATELAMLKAARRIQLWRGSIRSRLHAGEPAGGPWQRQ